MAVAGLLLGTESRHVRENKVVTFQSVGGTGALRIGAQFLSKEMGYDTFCLSSPSWGESLYIPKIFGGYKKKFFLFPKGLSLFRTQEKKLFPFFDVSYQGLTSGDVDDDIWPVRFFADRGLEFMVAYSLALSTALYSKYFYSAKVTEGDQKFSQR
uniref:Aspartate transaminase n=1 Tax=Timema bartmani TaxID=61472 RepID=A0A7R9ESJ3_9NEOP|nr:unnamed protein product [Timema bartmani]